MHIISLHYIDISYMRQLSQICLKYNLWFEKVFHESCVMNEFPFIFLTVNDFRIRTSVSFSMNRTDTFNCQSFISIECINVEYVRGKVSIFRWRVNCFVTTQFLSDCISYWSFNVRLSDIRLRYYPQSQIYEVRVFAFPYAWH